MDSIEIFLYSVSCQETNKYATAVPLRMPAEIKYHDPLGQLVIWNTCAAVIEEICDQTRDMIHGPTLTDIVQTIGFEFA